MVSLGRLSVSRLRKKEGNTFPKPMGDTQRGDHWSVLEDRGKPSIHFPFHQHTVEFLSKK